MGDLGFGELLVIGIIALLIYGKDLPQIARKFAYYYNKIRRHLNEMRDEISRQIPAENINLDTTSPSYPYDSGMPPAPPTGLSAFLDHEQVILTWDASPNADYYNVKRSTPPEGYFATIATGISSTTYTDSPAFDGSTVSYVVTASNSYGESGDSMEASVTLAAPAPAETKPAQPPPAASDAGTAPTGPPAPQAGAPESPPQTQPPPSAGEPEVPRMS